MLGTHFRLKALVGLLTIVMPSVGFAADDFPLDGTFMQNRPCHGDGSDAKPLLVTIHEDTIEYRGGTCVLTDKRLDGKKLSVHVTCKGRSGSVLSGDISFTLHDDGNLEMIDQDRNYRVMLSRCPR